LFLEKLCSHRRSCWRFDLAGLELSFSDVHHASLSVRRFSVREALSEPFDVTVRVVSSDVELDLESLVGQRASLVFERSLLNGQHERRVFSGICRSVEHVRSEDRGLSTYDLRLVPALWLLSQRSDHRIFQHRSIPAIVRDVLEPWRISTLLRLDEPASRRRISPSERWLRCVVCGVWCRSGQTCSVCGRA
jgi:uncharacterized protein involved in type VI secretion and phage assembly